MVELRKRPAPKETATPAPAPKRSASKPRAPAKASAKATKGASKVDTEADSASEPPATATVAAKSSVAEEKKSAGTAKKEKSSASPSAFPLSSTSPGTKIPLEPTFSKTITLHTSKETTLKELLKQSKRGIIIFSYPKASTSGCTTQACLFRDNYNSDTDDADKAKTNLQAQGFSIYGLSADSVKANSNFVAKQSLPYELICDTDAVVSGPLGLKKPGGANVKGTTRGVVLLAKVDGDDDEAEVGVYFLGGPQKTLDACLDWIAK